MIVLDQASLSSLASLAAKLPTLTGWEASFAGSVLKQAADKGSLSEKQLFCVMKILAPKPVAPKAPEADLSAIATLFANNSKAKFPAIVIQIGDAPALRLSKAGQKSKFPGTINVCDTGKGFEDRVWFGRIGLDGKFVPAQKCTQAVIDELVAFAADPAGQAASFGHRTGNCCFCMHALDNDHSVALGYGPICAGKWGLPHSYSGKLACQEVAA
jgi:hypothetical protein